jgi:preprotein translocase subunit SecA
LAEWARSKFNIEINVDELVDVPKREVASVLHQRVREAYGEREVCYPAEWCIESAFGTEGADHAAAADTVVGWVRSKYRINWRLEEVQSKSPGELRELLVALNREFADHKLEEEIDENIKNKDEQAAIEWAKQRFGPAWSQRRFEQGDGDLHGALLAQGREMLRWELTRLEQFVLLRLYDQAWKDHLLEMDHLKTAIMQRPLGGDQTHPQSQFAIEGRDLFTQMWARIAARVTDIIFKVKAVGGPGQEAPRADTARRLMAMSYGHADATGAGLAAASRDQEAAMRAQNVDGKVETIRRERPRVGRNAPCPCGSGKKFKQCHGRT